MSNVQGYARALYYPTMNVEDEAWLKSALLYWDKIETIVPVNVAMPFVGYTQEACAAAGVLAPLHVSEMPDVLRNLGQALTSANWQDIMTQISQRRLYGTSGDFENTLLHAEKMSGDLQLVLKEMGLLGNEDRNGWFQADPQVANLYMSCLAEEVAFHISASSITDKPKEFGFQLAKSLANDKHRSSLQNVPATLVQLAFRKLKIDPATPLERLLRFREDHAEELARFRGAMRALAQSVSDVEPGRLIGPVLDDIWQTDVEPSVTAIAENLKEGGIATRLEGVVRLIGAIQSANVAEVIAQGHNLFASFTSVRKEKKRANPYSYLVDLRAEFGEPLGRAISH